MKSGFTLIELLIVIAIISMLASIVFGSLSTARNKGADAAVKSNLNSLRSQMGLFSENNGNIFTGGCTTDNSVVRSLAAAKNSIANNVNLGGLGDGECADSDLEWAAWVNLKNDSTFAWCVDSSGIAKEIPVQNSNTIELWACP